MAGPSGSALPPSACPPTPVRALRAARRRGGRHCAPPRHGNQLHCFSPLHAVHIHPPLRGAAGEGDHYGAKVGGGGGGKGVVLVLFLPQGQYTRAKTRTLTISLSGWQWRCAAWGLGRVAPAGRPRARRSGTSLSLSMVAGGLQQDAGDRRELRAARRAAGGELSLSLYTPWWGNRMAAPREGRGARRA